MTKQEKEKYKKVLLEINHELPKGDDCFNISRSTISHREPSRVECAVADIAGILFAVLNEIEVEK